MTCKPAPLLLYSPYTDFTSPDTLSTGDCAILSEVEYLYGPMRQKGEKIIVWVIDDEENLCTTLSAALNTTDDIDCKQCFGRCDIAFKELRQNEEPPDVVLLDIGLPGMNGLDGIRPLKEMSPSTKIVMMTVNDKDKSIFRAMNDGAVGYVLKGSSFTLENVARSIREAHDGGAPLDSKISKKLVEMFKSVNSPLIDYGLTERETEVLGLIVEGFSMVQIANKLRIMYNTVASHYNNILEKLGVHDKGQLVKKAILEHLI